MPNRTKESKETLQKENTRKLIEAKKQLRIYLDQLIAFPDDLVQEYNICCQCNY